MGPYVEAVALRGGEVCLDVANGGSFDSAFAGDPRRATTLGWVCQVDCVALVEKVGGPARAIVGCIEEILGLRVRARFGVMCEGLTVPVWPAPGMNTKGYLNRS